MKIKSKTKKMMMKKKKMNKIKIPKKNKKMTSNESNMIR